jgi:hypothetical protein
MPGQVRTALQEASHRAAGIARIARIEERVEVKAQWTVKVGDFHEG